MTWYRCRAAPKGGRPNIGVAGRKVACGGNRVKSTSYT
jgi:hypothetical protein